jgi:replication factor C subunit 2/4
MEAFFGNKAQRKAAATNGNSSKAPAAKENTRLQPWVEK